MKMSESIGQFLTVWQREKRIQSKVVVFYFVITYLRNDLCKKYDRKVLFCRPIVTFSPSKVSTIQRCQNVDGYLIGRGDRSGLWSIQGIMNKVGKSC